MAKYLIDVNLPYRFSLWQGENFIDVKDIDEEWSDTQIWNHARTHNFAMYPLLRLALGDLSSPVSSYLHIEVLNVAGHRF